MASSIVMAFGFLAKMENHMPRPSLLAPFQDKLVAWTRMGRCGHYGMQRSRNSRLLFPSLLSIVITDGCGCQVHIYCVFL